MDITLNNNGLKPAKLFSVVFCPPGTDCEKRTPIIMVHGAGATSGTWNSVKQDIAINTKRKVIVVDLRNHGKSEWPEEFSLDHGVVDLENFAMQQNISKAIWMGHSLGGRMLLGLSFKRPDLVEKMILLDTFLHMSSTWEQFLEKMGAVTELFKRLPRTITEKEAESRIMKYCEVLFPKEAKQFKKSKKVLLPIFKDAKTGEFKSNFDMDLIGKAGNLQFDLSSNPTFEGKTLVLIAKNSCYMNKNDYNDLLKHLPNSCEEGIKGESHSLHVENPKEVIRAVSEFINKE